MKVFGVNILNQEVNEKVPKIRDVLEGRSQFNFSVSVERVGGANHSHVEIHSDVENVENRIEEALKVAAGLCCLAYLDSVNGIHSIDNGFRPCENLKEFLTLDYSKGFLRKVEPEIILVFCGAKIIGDKVMIALAAFDTGLMDCSLKELYDTHTLVDGSPCGVPK